VKENVYDCINMILSNLGDKLIEIPESFLIKRFQIEENKQQRLLLIETKKKEKELLKVQEYQRRIDLINSLNLDKKTKGYYDIIGKHLNMSGNGVKKFMKKYF
jgi:hypothetical protein